MTCRVCEEPAFRSKSARGLCLGHAFLFLLGPWETVEEFILKRRPS